MYSVSVPGATGGGVAGGLLAAQLFPMVGVEGRVPSILIGVVIVLAGYAAVHRHSTSDLPS